MEDYAGCRPIHFNLIVVLSFFWLEANVVAPDISSINIVRRVPS